MCFRKAQLCSETGDYDADDDLPISEWILKFNLGGNKLGMDLESYVSVDDQMETFQVLCDAEIIAEVQKEENKDVENNAEEEEEGIVCLSLQEAMQAAATLSRFFYFRDTSSAAKRDADKLI